MKGPLTVGLAFVVNDALKGRLDEIRKWARGDKLTYDKSLLVRLRLSCMAQDIFIDGMLQTSNFLALQLMLAGA